MREPFCRRSMNGSPTAVSRLLPWRLPHRPTPVGRGRIVPFPMLVVLLFLLGGPSLGLAGTRSYLPTCLAFGMKVLPDGGWRFWRMNIYEDAGNLQTVMGANGYVDGLCTEIPGKDNFYICTVLSGR